MYSHDFLWYWNSVRVNSQLLSWGATHLPPFTWADGLRACGLHAGAVAYEISLPQEWYKACVLGVLYGLEIWKWDACISMSLCLFYTNVKSSRLVPETLAKKLCVRWREWTWHGVCSNRIVMFQGSVLILSTSLFLLIPSGTAWWGKKRAFYWIGLIVIFLTLLFLHLTAQE